MGRHRREITGFSAGTGSGPGRQGGRGAPGARGEEVQGQRSRPCAHVHPAGEFPVGGTAGSAPRSLLPGGTESQASGRQCGRSRTRRARGSPRFPFVRSLACVDAVGGVAPALGTQCAPSAGPGRSRRRFPPAQLPAAPTGFCLHGDRWPGGHSPAQVAFPWPLSRALRGRWVPVDSRWVRFASSGGGGGGAGGVLAACLSVFIRGPKAAVRAAGGEVRGPPCYPVAPPTLRGRR